MKRLFAVIRRRGPGWQEGQPLEKQADWRAHATFMDALFEEGFVILAGPMENTSEALVVVRAESPEEVHSRLAEDPWTRNGLLSTTRIAAWTLRLGTL
jgi:uncharacterized protein